MDTTKPINRETFLETYGERPFIFLGYGDFRFSYYHGDVCLSVGGSHYQLQNAYLKPQMTANELLAALGTRNAVAYIPATLWSWDPALEVSDTRPFMRSIKVDLETTADKEIPAWR